MRRWSRGAGGWIWIGVMLCAAATWEGAAFAFAAAATGRARPLATATFAGGCFWCMEPPFEALAGVVSVTAGYSGGSSRDPSYEEVSSGRTGHAESIQIVFDPAKISYERLLDVYWHNIDPTSADGQFCDRGTQYRSAIFTRDEAQRRLALLSRHRVMATLKRPVVTQIVPFQRFYPAEAYHQDYYKKNPAEYHAYRLGCGRDRRLKELWGDAAPAH
jgi:peptide-methionine (S)-S-oxide reductase